MSTAPIDDAGYGDGIDRSDAAIARRNNESRVYAEQQDAIATAEAREGYVPQEQLDAALASVATLTEALERYYQQDIQLYALARSLRSLESFNGDKARREHMPYRVHLANAYGASATAIERITSKEYQRSTSASASTLKTFADSLVRLVERWREFANPFTQETTAPSERITRFDTLCKETHDLFVG